MQIICDYLEISDLEKISMLSTYYHAMQPIFEFRFRHLKGILSLSKNLDLLLFMVKKTNSKSILPLPTTFDRFTPNRVLWLCPYIPKPYSDRLQPYSDLHLQSIYLLQPILIHLRTYIYPQDLDVLVLKTPIQIIAKRGIRKGVVANRYCLNTRTLFNEEGDFSFKLPPFFCCDVHLQDHIQYKGGEEILLLIDQLRFLRISTTNYSLVFEDKYGEYHTPMMSTNTLLENFFIEITNFEPRTENE